ncbi:HAD-IB family hydrolase, partial [Burkholderia multivorans]
LGWTDVYTLTKAMAERVAEAEWADQGHRVSFVRPSIIESALRLPHPGWIDGFKVADPLIMAYANGGLTEFPGPADSVLDIIPVDFVVNVILALAAEDESTAAEAGARYFHVVSGTSNPLPFHQMVSTVREYFLDRPIPDPEGEPTPVPEWSFPSSELIEQRIRLKELSSRL